MPFYEYECPHCKFQQEVLQKISDPTLKKCPSCGKAGFKRLISAPVFRLKGSGWYETDFKSDKENKRNLVGEDREESKSSAADTQADGKPETKPEAKPDAAEAKEAKTETAAPKAETTKAADSKQSQPSGGRRSTSKTPAKTSVRRAARKAK